MSEQSPPKGISAHGIARETGHSAVAIYYRLRTMGIQPSIITESGHCFYDPSVVDTLRQVMRGPRTGVEK